MSRLTGFALFAALLVSAFPPSIAAAAKGPSVSAGGNHAKCSIMGRASFRLGGSGWKPHSTVQLTILYPDSSPKSGQIYSPLANNGRYRTDKNGVFRSKNTWTCWPTKTLNYADYTGTYILVAHQLGAYPPVITTSYFEVVK